MSRYAISLLEKLYKAVLIVLQEIIIMPPLQGLVKQFWIDELIKQTEPSSDGFSHCPRCDHGSKRRDNLRNHLCKDNPCQVTKTEKAIRCAEHFHNESHNPSVEVHGDYNTTVVTNTNTNSHNTTHTNTTIQQNVSAPVVNITLLPFRALSTTAWQELFKKSIVTIRKRLGSDVQDVDKLMLATLKLMSLNEGIPQNHCSRFNEDVLEVFDPSLQNRSSAWLSEIKAIKSVLGTVFGKLLITEFCKGHAPSFHYILLYN